MTKEELLNKQNEIDERIKQIWGENCSLDGITDIDKYLITEKRILWILKEMNRNYKKTGTINQREYLRNEAGYNLRTWNNVLRVTAGTIEFFNSNGSDVSRLAFNSLPKFEMVSGNKGVRYYNSNNRGEDVFPLDEIAMININKGIGGSSSKNSVIKAYYAKPEIRKLILEQIDYINPSVIIVCNSVEQLLCDLAEQDDISKYTAEIDSDNLYYKSGNRLIISTGHPLIRGQKKGLTSEKYCNDILDLIYDFA